MITSPINQSNQQTLKTEIIFSGIGLHSGIHSNVKITSEYPNSGITFIRTDLKENNTIKAIWSNVSATNLSTTISNEKKASVSTIEHLMSALSGMHVDNAKVYIDGPEIPIMDGSSLPFVELIEKAEKQEQNNKRKILKILREIIVYKDDSYVRIIPSNQFSIDFEIEFNSPLINKQACQLQLVNGNYKSDISYARTFGFEKDVKELRKNGFAIGGTLDNAVVVGEHKILNKEGLRFKDEFVRHKMLDCIGDLYLSGYPVEGYFYGRKSGHFLNNKLLKKLLSDKENYKLI